MFLHLSCILSTFVTAGYQTKDETSTQTLKTSTPTLGTSTPTVGTSTPTLERHVLANAIEMVHFYTCNVNYECPHALYIENVHFYTCNVNYECPHTLQ